jgi:hypothetical protein
MVASWSCVHCFFPHIVPGRTTKMKKNEKKETGSLRAKIAMQLS